MKCFIACTVGFCTFAVIAVPKPGLMQYRLMKLESGKFATPDNWTVQLGIWDWGCNNAIFSETGVVASIDEVRFAMFAESADWAKAEYDTETSETFVTNTGAQKFVKPGFAIVVR